MDKEFFILKETLLKAGKLALHYWNKKIKTRIKTANYDIVTDADYQIDKFLIRNLKNNFPNDDILTEESFNDDWSPTDSFFVVDPIDGTAAFQRGMYDWTISIAKIKNGKIVLGMIYCPQFDELFHARINQGTFKNGKKIFVSNMEHINQSIINISQDIMFMYHDLINVELSLSKKARLTWKTSSSSIAYAKLAEGKIDAALHPKQPIWDITPGKIIVEEAGGKFTNWKGEEKLDFTGKRINDVLMSNGLVHKKILVNLNQ